MEKKVLKVLAVSKGDSDLDKNIIFLDEENGTAIEKRVRLGKYDETSQKTVEDSEKAEKVEQQLQDVFGVAFEDLDMVQDKEFELFVQDGNAYFAEFFIADKPTMLDKGELYTFEIVTVEEKDEILEIVVYDAENDKNYVLSGFRYTKKVGDNYLKFDAMVVRAHEKFEQLFKIKIEDVEDVEQFKGNEILVECGEYSGYKFVQGKKVM